MLASDREGEDFAGVGHGTVVDIRAVIYDSRKQLKMKVSLRRKIHIMAFPQEHS